MSADRDPASRAAASFRRSVRATLLGVLINALLAAVKIVAGVLGNAYALIADGMESTLDILSSLLVWGGLRIAAAPADEEHPYGHGKAESLAAMVVALTLLGGAIGLAVQSVREIITPHHAPAPFTLVVLVTVVTVKELLFRFAFRVGTATGSTAVQADAWHHRSDAITSAAAFIGISLALFLGEGYEACDDWAALLACGVIGWNGIRLFRPALAEVMDAAPPVQVEDEVRRVAGAVDGVRGLEKCRIRRYGTWLHVDLHVLVDAECTVSRGHAISHTVKDALRAADPRIADVLVHIEPFGED